MSHYNNDSTRKLKHIDIELTRSCNLKCIHCSTGLDIMGDELSIEEIKRTLFEASLLGLENVGFTGGEPFLRKRKLEQLISYCKNELGIPIHVHTNGTLISNNEAEKIKQLGIDVSITLYGSHAKTHDTVTGTNGSMKYSLKGLYRLLQVGVNIFVYIIPMKCNLHEIIPLIRMVSKKGCKKLRILSLSPTGRAMQNYSKIALKDDQILWLNKKLKALRDTDIELYGGFCTRQFYPSLKMLPGHYSCLAAENRIHVDAFGNIFPCTASSGRSVFSGGNIRMANYTLSDIWNYSPLFQFIRKFHSNPPRKCRSCALYKDCRSGCRVIISYKYGNVTIPDPQCKGPSCAK